VQVQYPDMAYRNGRLILPSDLADRSPGQVASWLGDVPVSDRAKAFRAIPLNIAAAAFLVMEARNRVGLIAGLDRKKTHYLLSLLKDELLMETLGCAGEDVHGVMMSELPEWRQQRLQTLLDSPMAQVTVLPVNALPKRQGMTRIFQWLRKAG